MSARVRARSRTVRRRGPGRTARAAALSTSPCRRGFSPRSSGGRVRPGGPLGDPPDHIQLAVERERVAVEGIRRARRRAGGSQAPNGAPARRRPRARPGHRATRAPCALPPRPPPRADARARPGGSAPAAGSRPQRRSGRARGSSNETAARRNASGSWTRIPAPSPVPASAPSAPRCSRCASAASAALDRLVASRSVKPGDEGDAAGVVLERRVVETVEAHEACSSPDCGLVRRGEEGREPASPVEGARTWRREPESRGARSSLQTLKHCPAGAQEPGSEATGPRQPHAASYNHIMERKLATVLFVDLVDSSSLLAGGDPEVVRRQVTRYFECASERIRASRRDGREVRRGRRDGGLRRAAGARG